MKTALDFIILYGWSHAREIENNWFKMINNNDKLLNIDQNWAINKEDSEIYHVDSICDPIKVDLNGNRFYHDLCYNLKCYYLVESLGGFSEAKQTLYHIKSGLPNTQNIDLYELENSVNVVEKILMEWI